MKKNYFETENSIGHYEGNFEQESNEEILLPSGMEFAKSSMQSNDAKSDLEQVKTDVANQLLEYAQSFHGAEFNVRKVNSDGTFTYNLVFPNGQSTTYKANWSVVLGLIKIDLTEQQILN